MAGIQITCITLGTHRSHEHITHVGTASAKWTREQVIVWIDQGTYSFYVSDGYGNTAVIGVVREAGKAAYLRTHADGKWTDNLLALPSCA